jgi:hypothetical protein
MVKVACTAVQAGGNNADPGICAQRGSGRQASGASGSAPRLVGSVTGGRAFMREGDFRQMQAPTTGSTATPVDVGSRAPFMAAPARAALARSHVGQRILSFVVAWVTQRMRAKLAKN